MIKIYRVGEFRTLTTGTRVMESTIVSVYIKITKGSATPFKSHTALFETLLKSLFLKSEISENCCKVPYISCILPYLQCHVCYVQHPHNFTENFRKFPRISVYYVSRDAVTPDT